MKTGLGLLPGQNFRISFLEKSTNYFWFSWGVIYTDVGKCLVEQWGSRGCRGWRVFVGRSASRAGSLGTGTNLPRPPMPCGVMLRLSVGANGRRGSISMSVPIPWLGGTVGQVIAIALMGLRFI